MSYYGESASYYGNERPPYDRPPYDRPPYERPPYEEHRGPSYDRPPYEESRSYDRPPYEEHRSYDSRPRPPHYPPPPLPMGWVQEWEPSTRRAFFFETSTGRAEWTLPADLSYGGGEASRGVGDDYYAPAPVPPSGYPPQEGYPPQHPPQEYGGEYKEKKEKKSSDTGKLLAAGAAGLALGGIGGAILGHELTENDEEEKQDSEHSSSDEAHYSDDE